MASEHLDQLIAEIKRRGNLPRHVAVIMDGNGRWAKRFGMPRVWGHHKGVGSVREVVVVSSQLGLQALTLFAFSEENWSRPEYEVKTLLSVLDRYVVRERQALAENNIRFKAIGDISKLPQQSQNLIAETEKYLSNCTGLVLNVALSYGGRKEIVQACRSIAKMVESHEISLDQVDEKLVSENLYLSDLPDPDLLIRTSGEQRISNFLLWQIAYSELYFSDLCWPEFRKNEFLQAIQAFQDRHRRFGTSEQDRELTTSELEALNKEMGLGPC